MGLYSFRKFFWCFFPTTCFLRQSLLVHLILQTSHHGSSIFRFFERWCCALLLTGSGVLASALVGVDKGIGICSFRKLFWCFFPPKCILRQSLLVQLILQTSHQGSPILLVPERLCCTIRLSGNFPEYWGK